MGKPDGGAPEKSQGMNVVLGCDTRGHNIICNNFLTLHKLGQEFLKRKLTMVGRVRKNKPELIPQLLNTAINSCKFVFMADTSLDINMELMSTLHRDGRVCVQGH
jgi:hypothetical protein